MRRYNQAGFGVAGVVIVIAAVVIVVAAGFMVMRRNNDATPATQSTDTSVVVPTAPEVTSTDDLTKAEQALDNADVGTDVETDSAQLDTQLSGF